MREMQCRRRGAVALAIGACALGTCSWVAGAARASVVSRTPIEHGPQPIFKAADGPPSPTVVFAPVGQDGPIAGTNSRLETLPIGELAEPSTWLPIIDDNYYLIKGAIILLAKREMIRRGVPSSVADIATRTAVGLGEWAADADMGSTDASFIETLGTELAFNTWVEAAAAVGAKAGVPSWLSTVAVEAPAIVAAESVLDGSIDGRRAAWRFGLGACEQALGGGKNGALAYGICRSAAAKLGLNPADLPTSPLGAPISSGPPSERGPFGPAGGPVAGGQTASQTTDNGSPRDDGDGESSHGSHSGGNSDDESDTSEDAGPVRDQCGSVQVDDESVNSTCFSAAELEESRQKRVDGSNPNPEDSSSEQPTVGQQVVAGLMAGGQAKVHVNVSDTALGTAVSSGRDEHWNPGEDTGSAPSLHLPDAPEDDDQGNDAAVATGLALAAHALAPQTAIGAHGPSVTNDDRMPPPDSTDPGNPNSTQATTATHLTLNTTIHP